MLKKYLLFFIFTIFLTGCATTLTNIGGRDFDEAKIGMIKKGVTTKEQVISLLGEPFTKNLDENGKERWWYIYEVSESTARAGYYSSKVTGQLRQKKLELIFDGEIVQNYVYSDTTNPIESTWKTR